jgi:hypothetical protein
MVPLYKTDGSLQLQGSYRLPSTLVFSQGDAFGDLERLANFGDDLGKQTHAEGDTHGQNEDGPQTVDDLTSLSKQT